MRIMQIWFNMILYKIIGVQSKICIPIFYDFKELYKFTMDVRKAQRTLAVGVSEIFYTLIQFFKLHTYKNLLSK